jgi:type II secretory ATPase GspE/PulE/Tfp pilus assembly ATPase PilB-like protein
MTNLRPTTFSREEALLRLLPGHRPSRPSARALLEGAKAAGRPFERFLLDQGILSRQELIHLLAELDGTGVAELEGEVVALRIHRTLPLLRALALRILPLYRWESRLYCLAEPSARFEGRPPLPGVQLVVLGVQQGLEPRIRRAYAELGRRDPGKLSFPQYLHRLGLLNRERAEALAGHKNARWMPLLEEAGVPEELAYAAGSAFFDLPLLNSNRLAELADGDVLRHVQRSFLESSGTMPLRVEGQKLWVAVVDTPDLQPLDALASSLGCTKLHVLLTSPGEFAEALGHLPLQDVVEASASVEPAGSSVPAIVERLLREAVERECSDIHIERYEHRVEVRVRKDGALVPLRETGVTVENVQEVVSKLKVDSRMDISESRRPQDGAFRRHFEHGHVDFRVSTLPTLWGETMVLRVLVQGVGIPSLEQLGFEAELLARLRRLLLNPQGLLLVTGPTGSGKTTTLYSIIEELEQPGQKIVTAEDPIEYALEGIQQSQVDEAIGNTFDRYVRAFMRQDPDVILVGEIRDRETAHGALRAALTGHLILSTVHANDVFGVVRRIMDLEVEEGLLAQTLLAVLGQRLARRVCLACAEPDSPPEAMVREFFPEGLPPGAKLQRGKGCEACGGTGYSGRVLLAEYWEPSEPQRRLLEQGQEPSALRQVALAGGFQPLVEHAARLAAAGLTTLEELRTVVPYEQILRRHAQGAGRGAAAADRSAT